MFEEVLDISPDKVIEELLPLAIREKEKVWGKDFEFCSIINAKSGLCDAGCKFCAQAYPEKTKAPVYPLVKVEKMLEGARKAKENRAKRYSIVTSGKRISKREIETIVQAALRIKEELNLEVDVSLGIIPRDFLLQLKSAGVKRIHHNLETSKEFYPNITRKIDWQEKFRFCEMVKEEGMELCCGGLFGMGEGKGDWISLVNSLKTLSPESVPVNFLIPIPGTPFEKHKPPHPMELLKLLIYMRLEMPETEIRLCGGREHNLRDLQSFAATFVNGFMVGGYLTRGGREPQLDYQLVIDLGLKLITDP